MSIFQPSNSRWTSRMLSIFRIVTGLVYISVGTMKMFGYPKSPVPIPPFSVTTELGIAAILEVFGGTAIVLGFLVRPISFVLAGEMMVAYFQYHFPVSPWPTISMGIPAIMYCFLFLYMTFAGGGEWSIDTFFARRRLHRGS
jgi:putative oxidoreductase